MSFWQLEVLGKACLCGGDQTFMLERKTAALLTYLALEGPTRRSRLAGLFWPDAPERTARNNLSALIARLKKLTGVFLLAGTDALQVTNALTVDAADLKVATLTGEHRTIIDSFGPLLAPYDYDDLPDFEEWLLTERERIHRHYQEALAAEIAGQEKKGTYREAVPYAERLLASDPASEEAHRYLMRLHYLTGDRPAALEVYAWLKELLQREFGVSPLPETVALATEIEKGAVKSVVKPQRSKSRIPLRVLRPPLLVGREQEWARLEAAWQVGQAIAISGPPGSGKTRLMMDFARSKGPYLVNEGRPGDAVVPLLSLARGFRRFFTSFAEERLEPWLALELARLLPDLFDLSPPPLTSSEDQLRFHEAMYKVERLIMVNVAAVVVDDLQFYDPASFDAASRATARVVVEGMTVQEARTLVCFRTGEMPAPYLRYLEGMALQGLAVHIELAPLAPGAVGELVGSLELESLSARAAEALAGDLHRYTGGNPLFIVETLKHLLETGRLEGRLPARLTPTGKVSAMIRGRLSRLSPTALHLAWAAAVAQTDFEIELASYVLEQNVFALAAPWRELEAAQILAGGWFSHDLLYETVLENIPAPIRTLLHRRCAAYLADGNPARVTQHLLAAGDDEQAVPYLLRAAENAEAIFQRREAANFLRQVDDINRQQGEAETG